MCPSTVDRLTGCRWSLVGQTRQKRRDIPIFYDIIEDGILFVCGESIHEAQKLIRRRQQIRRGDVKTLRCRILYLSYSPDLSPLKVNSHDHGSSLLKRQCRPSTSNPPAGSNVAIPQVAQPWQNRVKTRIRCNQWINNVLARSLWIEQPAHLPSAIALQPRCRNDTEAAGGKKPAGSTGTKHDRNCTTSS